MEDDYEHVSEELVYCLTNVPGPGLVGGIPADLGGCLCTVGVLGISEGGHIIHRVLCFLK